jgi:hypothetical protein
MFVFRKKIGDGTRTGICGTGFESAQWGSNIETSHPSESCLQKQNIPFRIGVLECNGGGARATLYPWKPWINPSTIRLEN